MPRFWVSSAELLEKERKGVVLARYFAGICRSVLQPSIRWVCEGRGKRDARTPTEPIVLPHLSERLIRVTGCRLMFRAGRECALWDFGEARRKAGTWTTTGGRAAVETPQCADGLAKTSWNGTGRGRASGCAVTRAFGQI